MLRLQGRRRYELIPGHPCVAEPLMGRSEGPVKRRAQGGRSRRSERRPRLPDATLVVPQPPQDDGKLAPEFGSARAARQRLLQHVSREREISYLPRRPRERMPPIRIVRGKIYRALKVGDGALRLASIPVRVAEAVLRLGTAGIGGDRPAVLVQLRR